MSYDGGPRSAPEPPPQPAPIDPSSDQAALTEASRELDEVDAALARLEDGTFDRCDVCGHPIGRDRLLQDPLLTRCADHSRISRDLAGGDESEPGRTVYQGGVL